MNLLEDRMKQLVARGKTQAALKQLQHIDAFDNDLQNQIEILNNRYYQLQNQLINGIADQEAINLENNRITNALLLLLDRLPTNNDLLKHKLNKLAANLGISIEQAQTVIKALEERYQSRLYQKMDNYLSLSLQLSYTQEGTDQKFVETFFDEESKGADFIQKNCLEVLKQHQHLLILGDPGAGKTTLLLQLAINLLQQYEELQIPIIFNLASWTKKETLETAETSFKQWLQNVLVNGYGFSKEFAAKSLAQNTILPLLDGFDEVGKAYKEEAIQNELRQHCLEAIGQYITDENVQQFIICSRRKEYQAAPQNAPIRAEILINPLSIQQIEKAFAQQKSSERTNKERTLINKVKFLKEQNHPLLEVLCTPFYFNLIFDSEELTQPLTDNDELPQAKAEIEHYLLSTFVQKKTKSIADYPKPKTFVYLSWLANWMNRRDVVGFELADLQPGILRRTGLFSLLFGLCAGLAIGIIQFLVYIIHYDLDSSLFSSSRVGLLGVLIVALMVGFNKNLSIQTNDIRQTKWSNLLYLSAWISIFKQTLKRALKFSRIFGLSLGLFSGLGLVFAIIIMFLFPELISVLVLVVVIVGIVFSWIFGLVIGFILGLVIGLVENLYQAVTTISFFKIIKTPYARLKSGWQTYCFRSLIMSLFLFTLFLYLNILNIENLVIFLAYYIIPIVLFLLFKMPLIHHFILRIALTIEKKAPLKYVKFLNAATKARILEKDGGHWRFRHQLIQDYFAQLHQKG